MGWLEMYRQPGETLVTLAQSLRYNGQVYQIHYFTTGDLRIDDSYFIARASPDYFNRQQVTALLISSNGQVITDEDLIEQVLLSYRAAHYLYIEPNEPLFYDPASLAEEMRGFTNWPVFIQFWQRLFLQNVTKRLFNSEEEEYSEALRGILSTQLELPEELQTIPAYFEKKTKSWGDTADTIQSVSEVIDEGVAIYKLDKNRWVKRVARGLGKTFESFRKRTEQGRSYVDLFGERIEFFTALDLFSWAARLFWITDLQKDRATELQTFVSSAGQEAALSDDMSMAYARVTAEVDNAWLQRGQIIQVFVVENSLELADRLGPELLADLLVKKTLHLWRWRITGYALVHSVSVGYLAGDLLFGIDDTYHNFQIGVRTDEWRETFRAERESLLRRTRNQSVQVFDAELAARYRAAYLLEAYASARVHRLYADGVQASARTGILEQIKRWRGEQYGEAADELRKIGMQIEAEAEESLGYPDFLDDAQRLIGKRLLLHSLTVDDLSPGFTRHGETAFWNPLPGGYAGQGWWTYNQAGKAVNRATWSLVLPEPGRYLVQVYIPAPGQELTKPYSPSAKYLVMHAQGETEVPINQAEENGRWVDLGLFEYGGNLNAVVSLDDLTGELPGETTLVFDAVRFIPEAQMRELLEGEPFNLEHRWQEYQFAVQAWWEDTSTGIEQAVNQWWEEQQQRINESFDRWWEEQQKKVTDTVERWWQDIQKQFMQWFEQQLVAWLNQCLGSVLLPAVAATGVFISRRLRKDKRSELRS